MFLALGKGNDKQWEAKYAASGRFQISKPLDLDTDPLKIIQFRVQLPVKKSLLFMANTWTLPLQYVKLM